VFHYPSFIRGNHWLPRKFGFAAQTVFCWILLPGTSTTYRVLVHEKEHVKDFWRFWALGVLLKVAFLGGVFGGLVWWLLTPFTYGIAYALAGFVSKARGYRWYHDNYFERKARRKAGEPV